MSAPRKLLVVFLLLPAAGLAGLARQYQANATLRHELTRRQTEAREHAQLEAEHRRLESAQVPPEQLAFREQERAALAGLANELEILRRRAAAAPSATTAAQQPSTAV